MRRVALISLLLVTSAGLGCLLELTPGVNCGDGFWDAAEECDPGVPASYEDACAEKNRPGGVAKCNPESCQIEASILECARCGDGFVDTEAGEECDGNNFNGQACVAGGQLQCIGCRVDRTACFECGNGARDEGEECDYRESSPGDFKEIKSCNELDSPYSPIVEYGSGTSNKCGTDCRWERSTCSYCGNDQRDDPTPLTFQGGLPSLDEVCDGEEVRVPDLEEYCRLQCNDVDDLALRCSYKCAEDCRTFEPSEDMALGCCRKSGELCPVDGDPFPCCWELDNPEKIGIENACTKDLVEGQPQGNSRCR
ncbi:MAG: hypothetical protein H6713_03090 [Myxococcales bacterium]|nr:hypothetical protein [Myxococcales bacterium]MCB9748974.1 hypothetical protein [Myxococcales bacterium]